MKRLMISGFAAVALLAAATIIVRSHSLSITTGTATAEKMPVQELHRTAGAKNLPLQEFEDMSLVYSAGPKR
ncbi:MAG TPA: hypothetical protein VE267_19180 [Bradyrhizobium sp.]|nr:hypothetical protein [Bradyrhizobium sp.]